MKSTISSTSDNAETSRDADAQALAIGRAVLAGLALVSGGITSKPRFVPRNETGLEAETLKRLEKAGRVRVIKEGRRKLYSVEDIEALAVRAKPPSKAAAASDDLDATLRAIGGRK